MSLKVSTIALLITVLGTFAIELPGSCPEMPPSDVDAQLQSEYFTSTVCDLVPMKSGSYLLGEFPADKTCLSVYFENHLKVFGMSFSSDKTHKTLLSGTKTVLPNNDHQSFSFNIWMGEDTTPKHKSCLPDRIETFRMWSHGKALAIWACSGNAQHHDEGVMVVHVGRPIETEDHEKRAAYDALLLRYFISSGLRNMMRFTSPIDSKSCQWRGQFPCREVPVAPRSVKPVIIVYVVIVLCVVAVFVLGKFYLGKTDTVEVIG